MGYRIYLATLLLAGFTFTATTALIGFSADARAQGYAGFLPAENTGASDDKGALPFMSSQMGQQQGGGSAKVTNTTGQDEQATGEDEIEGNGDEQATADIIDEDGDGQPDAPDITDLYGLNGDTTLSTDNQGEPAGKTGFMAMIGGGDDKGPRKTEAAPDNEPVPENLYRAMEGGEKNDAERARLRMNRELELARAAHDKEIDAMNAARMRDHQIKAQAEIDRVTAIQQEAMAIVRDRMGTASPEETQLSEGDAPQEGTTEGPSDGAGSAEGDTGSDLESDDTGNTAE